MGTTTWADEHIDFFSFFYFYIEKEKCAPRLQLQSRDPLHYYADGRTQELRSFLGTAEGFLREIGTQESSFQWATNETAIEFASFLNDTL